PPRRSPPHPPHHSSAAADTPSPRAPASAAPYDPARRSRVPNTARWRTLRSPPPPAPECQTMPTHGSAAVCAAAPLPPWRPPVHLKARLADVQAYRDSIHLDGLL